MLSFTVISLFLLSQLPAPSAGLSCKQAETCSQCIQAGPECGWCEDKVYKMERALQSRCDVYDILERKNCEKISYPQHKFKLIKDIALRVDKGRSAGIQLRPQEVNIKLRPSSPYTFQVEYQEAKDYPMDLYVLMDLSYSMGPSRDTLSNLGLELAEQLKKITANYLIGFGSFVEKEFAPFVITSTNQTMCQQCSATYDFRHAMKLAQNGTQFSQMVAKAKLSGSNEEPEAGFDALMQSIVCESIGWRKNSRKLVLYVAGASFHIAGEGKLLGIVKPNDGKCHLNSRGEYIKSLDLDYPSISQIQSKISDKKIHVIFAVNETYLATYEHLSSFFIGSSATALKNNSANILQVIQSNYDAISHKVELKTEHSENITVKFESQCYGDTMLETNVCDKLVPNKKVVFNVTIQIDECPLKASNWKRTMEIYPVGLDMKVSVDIDMICECECKETADMSVKSPKCNYKGVYTCGICLCDEGYVGRKCECSKIGSNSTTELDKQCIQPGSNSICSDLGQCECGVCKCDNIQSNLQRFYSGQYCQCNDYSCDIINGQLCGGEKQGTCDCGKCTCKEGYEGVNCGCPISNDTCIASNGELCNGKGECKCGVCICNIQPYRGPKCEDCPTCPGMCSETKHCVQCKVFKRGNYTQEDCINKCPYSIKIVEQLGDGIDWKKCQFLDENQCTFVYQYRYSGSKILIEAEKETTCPLPNYVVPVAVVAGIILIGLIALLIYKCVTEIYDRREYARFMNSKKEARWDRHSNPLYVDPHSTYQNPVYAGKK